MEHEKMMKYAIKLAEKGVGRCNPNPLVGSVIVKNGEIIGKGYHEKYGGLHAERVAILNAREDVSGSTLYVTLEPCCHYGKTPPCTDIIISSGIKKVVIGVLDPNPCVNGKGVKILQQHGIEVIYEVLGDECRKQNEVFFNYILSEKPYVVMKYAMTLDGKIATVTGQSKWITGEKSRRRVHESRNRYSGIMVGVSTVIKDNPMLNCRLEDGVNPTRIICDSNLRTPLESNIVITACDIPTIIATTCGDRDKYKLYEKKDVKILPVASLESRVDLNDLMSKLGELKIDSILLEGGGELNFSALKSGIVNKVQAYIAPKIFGGASKSPVGGLGIEDITDSIVLKNQKIINLGEDICIESEVI